ncbi:hypothetical protein LAZ67_4002435, partial [Cordylochernes scorpioides]
MASFGKLENFDLSKPEGSLAAPEPLNDIDYCELTKLLTGYFCPKPNKSRHRICITYVAELRKLSENCEFIDLDDRLRDRLVCGLRNESLAKRPLSEKDLTFEKAVNLALCDESASTDASILQGKMPELNIEGMSGLGDMLVNETGRTIAIRASEHARNIRSKDKKSLIYQHIAESGHSFNLDNTTPIYSDIANKYQRLVLEALVSNTTPSLNRKIDLPPQYS